MNGSYTDNNNSEPTRKSAPYPMIVLEVITFAAALYSGLTASFISLVLASLCSALITCELMRRPSPIPYIGTILGFVVAGVADFSPFVLILPVMFVLPSLIMYLMLMKKRERIFTVVTSAAGYLIGLVLAVVVLVMMNKGGFSISLLRESVNDILNYLTDTLRELYAGYSGSNLVFNEVELNTALKRFTVAIPGMLIAASFAAAYFQSFVARAVLKKNGILDLLYREGWLPKASVVTAAVFVLSFVIGLFAGDNAFNPFFITLTNITVVLEVLFGIVGFSTVLTFAKSKTRLNGTVGALVVIGLIFFTNYFWYLLCIAGLAGTVADFVRSVRKKS